MIRVDILHKSLAGKEILRDIRFEVAAGEVVAILGPSGIGKTTMLGLIAQTDKDFDGVIECPARIGIVYQEPTLLPWRTVRQNVTLVHSDLSAADVDAALEDVGISQQADLFPGQLSLGQQRRLALARALAGEPDVLLLDEPFVSLDKERAAEMLALSAGLIKKVRPATIFVTHAEHEASQLATRIIRLGGQPATITDSMKES